MIDTDELKEHLKKQYVGYGRPAEARFLPRVWDGKHLYYPHFSEIGILWDSETTDKIMNQNEAFGWHFDIDRNDNAVCFDYILEACTGLKDKNGKLIYEGDILKYSYREHPDSSVCTNTCSVFWFGDGWGINPITGNRLIDFPETGVFHSHLYTVIGNIHEREKK